MGYFFYKSLFKKTICSISLYNSNGCCSLNSYWCLWQCYTVSAWIIQLFSNNLRSSVQFSSAVSNPGTYGLGMLGPPVSSPTPGASVHSHFSRWGNLEGVSNLPSYPVNLLDWYGMNNCHSQHCMKKYMLTLKWHKSYGPWTFPHLAMLLKNPW